MTASTGFRFVRRTARPDLYPNPAGSGERLLNAIFGKQRCTVCEKFGATVYVVRADGMWNGSLVCEGETPCAATAMAGYGDDVEPWTEKGL